MLCAGSRILRKQKGFTLVELMTVLIILSVILSIGVPKYLQVQAKAEWEADEATIINFAKAAETYAASMNKFKDGVTIKKLIDNKIIDGGTVLNRINGSKMQPTGSAGKSYKNEGRITIEMLAGSSLGFEFNTLRGNVRNLGYVVKYLIGEPPYGDMPKYLLDSETDEGANL
jgi:type IV pilus assembly protein PilA